jgi:hypothetical protein
VDTSERTRKPATAHFMLELLNGNLEVTPL